LRFLGDACIDIRVIKWLRSQGYDAIHLREDRAITKDGDYLKGLDKQPK